MQEKFCNYLLQYVVQKVVVTLLFRSLAIFDAVFCCLCENERNPNVGRKYLWETCGISLAIFEAVFFCQCENERNPNFGRKYLWETCGI